MQLKDYQLDDTDVSTDISDVNGEEQHSLSSENLRTEKKQTMSNSTSNGSEICESSDEKRKSNILVDSTKPKGFPPRIIQEMSMESPQASLWPAHRRQCSTPETGIVSDPNLFFNIQPDIRIEVDESENILHAKGQKKMSDSSSFDYENIKKIADELGSTQRKLEAFLKFSERGNMSKMKPIADKIACCMKEMYNSLETVIHNVNLDKEGIKTEPVNGKQQIEEPNSNKVDISNDHVKMRNQVKTFCEKYDCTVAFTVDEKSDQLVSVSIEQMNRIPDYIRVDVVSGSSGSLADHSSLSDSHSVNSLRKLPFQLPGRHSIPESSSASSASSVQQSSLRNFHQFLAPDKLPPNRSKNCICKCFCSLLKSSPAKTSVSATPDLLISSIENSKTETNNSKEIPQNTEEFLKGISHTSSEKVLSVDISELVKKDEALKTSNLSETSKSFEGFKLAETTKEEVSKNDSQSESKKVNKDLLVFGRWINKYYPGKIEDVTLEDWHDSDKPLKVLFFDGLPKMLANVFIIPATMLPPKMDIMCPVGDDLYEEGSLIKIENVIDENFQESLMFSVSIGDKVVSVPFEKVWFNESTKKQLGITPRKPKIPQLEMPWSSVLSRKRQLPSINEQNLTGKKDTTSLASAKSAKKLKTSGSSVKKATLNVKKEKSEPQFSKTLKRLKSSSDEDTRKDKKFIKKLEFEPVPSTSSAIVKDIVKESNNSSETDSSDFRKEEYIDVSDLDHEYYQISYKKSLEFGKIKSFSKHSVQEKDDTLGPIRNSEIFKGYNFVLTHSHQDSLHSQLTTKERTEIYKETRSSTENETDELNDETSDLESQLKNCPDFDYMRLRAQIKAGGGIIYDSIAEINKAEYAHTITISDYPCQTPNYLLSIALGIPIYRHDLIISSCKEDTPVSRMIRFGYLMPTGHSLQTGAMIERTKMKTKKPFKGFTCAINISSSPKFWKILLKAMGATVLSVNRSLTGCCNSISFILADTYISKQNFAVAFKENIPLVTKTWVIQSLIHGEQQLYNTSPEFTVTPD